MRRFRGWPVAAALVLLGSVASADLIPGPAPSSKPAPRLDPPVVDTQPSSSCSRSRAASAALFFVPTVLFGAGMALAARRRQLRRRRRSA
jgi:hypothetical protein